MIDISKYERELSCELSDKFKNLFKLEIISINVRCLNYPIYEFTIFYKYNNDKKGFSYRFISEDNKENEIRYLIYEFFNSLIKNL